MMQELRNFSKAFLIFVVVAFVGSIIFAWGMDIGQGSSAKGYIAKINGQEIDRQVYRNLIENYTDQLNRDGRVYLDWAKNVEILQEAWNQMVQDIVLEQHMNKIGLTVSDQEMFEYLWNYPPRYMWNEPSLLTDGRFDMGKYRQLLADENFSSYLSYIELQETPRIKRAQWAELMRSTIQITHEELMQEFRTGYEKIKVNYAYIPINNVREPEIVNDSAEVIEYYNQNSEQFKKDAQAELEYVVFNIIPTQADSNSTSDLIIWIQQASDSEEDIFQIMAATVSDDSRARNDGGDVGWVSRGRYPPEFDSVVFNLDSGEVAQKPIRTQIGWHIFRSEGKRTAEDGTEEVHVFQILKKFKPSGDTFSEIYSLAGQFLDAAKNTTFEEATALKGLEIISSGPFVEGNYCGKMGQSQEANDFAFSAEQGEISKPFMIANTKDQEYKIVVTRLKELMPAGTLTLEEAYSYADSRLKQEKTMQRAYELAQKVYDKSKTDFMLKDAAEEFEGVVFYETEFFTRSEVRATKLGNDPQFMGAAFGLSLGENNLSEPVYTGRGVAVIMLTGRVFNPDEFELVKDNIYNQLWAQKVNVTIQAWSDNLMNEAVIEDFRDMRVKWSF